jgi:hypothetical protein
VVELRTGALPAVLKTPPENEFFISTRAEHFSESSKKLSKYFRVSDCEFD